MYDRFAAAIHDKAIACGYEGCGIIPLEALENKSRIDERIQKIPESVAVYGFYDAFTNIHELYPWAKAAVVCTFWLGQYKFPVSLQGKYAKAFLLSPDTVPDAPVHQKKMDFEKWMESQHIRFVGGEDRIPVRLFPLRQAAVAAGLGIFRKNNFFYGKHGSYYMLEGYLIDVECEYRNDCHLTPCSEICNLCQQACKTHALCAPYTMNPLSCIFFLTTFGGGKIPEYLQTEDLEEWICGCDACQDVCPYNRLQDWDNGIDFPGLKEIVELLQPQNILTASDAELCEKVIPKTEAHISPKKVNTLRKCAAKPVPPPLVYKGRFFVEKFFFMKKPEK
jgi:epoxyqueuosine reductase